MEDNKKIQDQLLKELISKTSIEKPSANFTDKLMEKISLEDVPVRQGFPAMLKIFLPYFSGLAAMLIIAFFIYSGWDSISAYIDPSKLKTETLQNIFNSMTVGFSSVAMFLKNVFGSSVAIISVLSVLSVFLLDKIIRNLVPGRQNVSVF